MTQLQRGDKHDEAARITGEPGVCIVVVNYNGLDVSRECIASLLRLEYNRYAIVFIDNGSTDGSGKAMHELFGDKIVYLALPVNRGVTGGNNAGIAYAVDKRFDYVLFLNNDTIVEKSFLRTLVRTSLEAAGALAVPKIVCYYDQKRLDHFIGPELNWWTSQPVGYQYYPVDQPSLNIRSDIRVASTCCLLAPIAVFAAVGRMDENYFMYHDDSDFTLRASRAGYRMIYEPQAVIYHKCNITTQHKQPAFFQYYLTYRNFFYFYRKLCDRPFTKYLFLSKRLLILVAHYLQSYITHDAQKRRVIRLILRDIYTKKMGPPPDFNALI